MTARCGRVTAVLALALLIGAGPGAGPGPAAAAKRVIVLGFDGLDHGMMIELMEAGRLPAFTHLAETGMFQPLGTSIPPQSPVAWSNFITGMDSGGHGIFDFIHRDPETMFPDFSMSRTEGSQRNLTLGKYQIPLSPGELVLLRRGESFWERLEKQGIHTMIMRMPVNFPPSGTATRELSGMGTPDIRGTYGTFSYFTTDTSPFDGKRISGGHVYGVRVRNGKVKGTLFGPDNPFLVETEKTELEFVAHLDPEQPFVKLVVGEEELLLEEGDWTDWVPLTFDFIPTQSASAMARFYLKQVRPTFQLYVTPIDLDPMNPAMPISTPASFAKELAEATGRYYTEGMPEDTSALSEGVFTVEEFLQQAKISGGEIIAQYPWILDEFEREFDGGLLFYYTGNHDLVGHMLWRCMDPEHPAYDPEVHAQYADVMPQIIEELDGVVGYTLERIERMKAKGDDTTLIVMSDHGFSSWRRAMNLNSWLWHEGYLALKNPDIDKDPGFFLNVDWSRTRAYGVGLNGLYINVRGREKWGIVQPEDRRGLLEEIAYKLVDVVDPVSGLHAVSKAYISEDCFNDRGALEVGPDMIVGYAKKMRGANESALGEVPREIFVNNTNEWSGDHCMDHITVPGVLYANRPLQKPAPTLQSLAAAILAEFGVEGFKGDAAEGLRAIGYIVAEED
jgi:predicted AlkP superfamily phosphohydrolase/phosphomutase